MVSMIKRHMPKVDYNLVLFTDRLAEGFDKGFDTIYNVDRFRLKGWWNKLLLFNWKWHQLEGDILYFDIDMIIVGSLEPFCCNGNKGKFVTGYRFKKPFDKRWVGSTTMSIPQGFGQGLWDYYIVNGTREIGDQEYVRTRIKPDKHWSHEDLVSYKWHCREGLPEGAKLVSFHGNPNPSGVDVDWVVENWR